VIRTLVVMRLVVVRFGSVEELGVEVEVTTPPT